VRIQNSKFKIQNGPGLRAPLWSLLILHFAFCISANPQSAIRNLESLPTVGMEGRLEVQLPGTPLEARPVNEKSNLVVRVAFTRPHGTLFHYDLRYIGLVPGRYDLREHLIRKDGSATTDLPTMPVEVAPLLPPKHDMMLVAHSRQPLLFPGGYRRFITALFILWAVALVVILIAGRRRRKARQQTQVDVAAPTLAERLRPLVEQAAAGTLSSDGQAQLERMLLNYWRARLGLEEVGMAEAILKLRADAEAGALLRELENWLHRPPGSVKVDVEKVLEPYRQLQAGGSQLKMQNEELEMKDGRSALSRSPAGPPPQF